MTRPADPGRRSLLTGAFLERSEVPESAPLPPFGPAPPWLAEVVGPDACHDCGQPCVPACPERIVRLHPADHDRAGLPWLDFEAGPCTFCRACLEACPEAPEELPARALPPVALDQGRCLAAQGVVCVMCVGRCPERALSGHPGGAVKVDEDACTGCGACLTACPVEALSVPVAS